ncbi:MBL fold metallo-hydrolase [Candidatus Micrarchaeota archaeon]|nr:MBL fold metallo-hydrolase [Candidatus Micrarchaeota archaeon]
MLTASQKKVYVHAGIHQIALDCRGELGFCSHAHSDHVSGVRSAKGLIASDATFDLLRVRKYAKPDIHLKKRFPSDLKMELLNAGHILGSTQLHLSDGFSFTYTGDFKLRDSLTNKAAEVREVDTLAIECTYGLPQYDFPDFRDVCEKMASWAKSELRQGHSLVFGGYSLGKAQELVAFVNEYLDTVPVVDSTIHAVNQVYTRHGVTLHALSENSLEGASMLKKQFVAVFPYQSVNLSLASSLSNLYRRKVKCAVASGWDLVGMTPNAHASFCLSDHADFKELVDYVERAHPRRIVCMHGYNARFARQLKRRGFHAIPAAELHNRPAQSLLEFA